MLVTLEALQAKEGDALLLHHGKAASPELIVIDGGPIGVYKSSLRPRLDQIKASRAKNKPLPIQMMMVSHIDRDHIRGVLDLTESLRTLADEKKPLPFHITTLWHNSFEEIVGPKAAALDAAAAGAAAAAADGAPTPAGFEFTPEAALVLASVKEGHQLRDHAKRLNDANKNQFIKNLHFGGKLIKRPAGAVKTVKFDPGLSVTILGPDETRLDNLHKKWDLDAEKEAAKKVKAAEAAGAGAAAEAAAKADTSVYNLSSIIVLVEADGHRMLLCGDALGKHIADGLDATNLWDDKQNRRIHLDVFKLPHHGSIRNVDENLFRQVTADHYVISANGKDGNPDTPTLEALTKARGNARYTLHITNELPRLVEFFKADRAGGGRSYEVLFGNKTDKSAASLKINLGDELKK